MAAPTVTETISHTAQRRTLVFVVLLLLSTLLVFAAVRPLTVSGQGGLPPLPTDANDAVLLFPNAQDSNTVDEAGPSQRYLFLARRGDSIRIVMRRTNGDLNPALELTDVNGEVLETRRADLSGRNSVLPFTIPADGWYYVEAGREDGTEGDTNGEFTLLLEGASPALYELLPAGVPPTIEGRIVLHEAQIEQSEATVEDSYLLPLVTGQTLTVAVSGVESASVQIITSSGDVLAEGTESAFYTARSSQWVVVVVGQSSPSAYTVLFAGENGVEVAFAPSYLQDLVTATPLPTATITPSSTPRPTFTPSPTPRPVVTCPGFAPSRLYVGEMGRVTDNGQSNRLRSGPSRSNREITRIPPGAEFLVLEGPTCTPGMAWWRVSWQNIEGWTAEGADGAYYLEPLRFPPEYQPACPEGLPTRLSVGMRARVLGTDPNTLNTLAGSLEDDADNRRLALIPVGATITILDGPVCKSYGRPWWQVEYNGRIGWTAESENDLFDTYFLEPVN